MNRIDRLISVLTTLQSKKFVTADYIADKYEISVRTVYRDIKALGEIGVPIDYEPLKGYTVLQGFFLPPVLLTSDEANALIMIAKLSERYTDKTIHNHVSNAIDKIKSVLQQREKEKADLLQEKIGIYVSPETDHSRDHLTIIQNAIIDKQILKISYVNNQNEASEREIEPIGMSFYTNQWHLIGWCWARRGYRDFKVLQIRDLKNTGQPFRKEAHFTLQEYINSLT
ncbi:helix-turn-helix transcriptional regulator [Chryseobacterium indologenes]|uniref:DNA-binding transcriptional regulator n=1 Tax=Chryseobacterium indologenes TaxID=253 RepID=A0A0N0ZZ54_CHRID|nr:YafY family protein [Chryseobacterium indologenes]KPE52155.1 DNA-binding transcriptional regulator [Chryseobacterium indologenes]